MTAQSIYSLHQSKYHSIDPRLKTFLSGWKLVEIYKNKTVNIPGTWNSRIFATKYFRIIKEPHEPNYDPNGAEDEVGLTLECGWPGYDTECIINLLIIGPKVKTRDNAKVGAEILKAGGASMKLYYNNKLVTDFTKKTSNWWCPKKEENPKVWIDNMLEFEN